MESKKEIQTISRHTREYTTVAIETIRSFLDMPEDKRLLFDLNTSGNMRKRLRETMPKQNILCKLIKDLNGKETYIYFHLNFLHCTHNYFLSHPRPTNKKTTTI